MPKTLYIRPFMFATESHVGVRPSQEYRFCIFTCWELTTQAVKVKVELHYTRAAMGGTGAAKRPATTPDRCPKLAKSEGYDQILWTDAATHCCGGMRHHGRGLRVGRQDGGPQTSDTVLAGITRASAVN